MLVMIRRTSVCSVLTEGPFFIPALYDMLQGMNNAHFQGRRIGAASENSFQIRCECTRPSTNVLCNMCGYMTVGRIRKQCFWHPMVSVFTTGFTVFLGVFAKLRKATVTFVVSVRPSAWNNLASAKRIFVKVYI